MEKVRNMLLLNDSEINKIHLQNSSSNLNEILEEVILKILAGYIEPYNDFDKKKGKIYCTKSVK